jgi:acyl-CoA synthetase (AMP-forming)/AMP-acid ligase II
LKDPAKSAEMYRVIDGQTYAVAGDYARVDADGVFTLLGRGSTTINTGGEKVHPEEVEAVIKTLPDVEDCLVLGLPDERWMQRVVAIVQVSAGADLSEDEVVGLTHESLAGYKSPKQVVFVETIPRRPNGKPEYEEARQLAADALGVILSDEASSHGQAGQTTPPARRPASSSGV